MRELETGRQAESRGQQTDAPGAPQGSVAEQTATLASIRAASLYTFPPRQR